MMQYRNSLRLNCFSPLVMILTFAFEIASALYIVWRYKFLKEMQLVVAVLVCLAIFQLAEYMICETALGLSSLDWARVGWVSISFLPPLGVHLGLLLARKQQKILIVLSYAIATAFSGYFLTVGHGITDSACLGNYVIFEAARPVLTFYIAYYYIWLAVGLSAAFVYAKDVKNANRRAALRWLGVGYAAFIVPTVAVNIIDPSTVVAIPSIMCGFAVILAAILLLAVVPRIGKIRK